jgi:hypothetical protein
MYSTAKQADSGRVDAHLLTEREHSKFSRQSGHGTARLRDGRVPFFCQNQRSPSIVMSLYRLIEVLENGRELTKAKITIQ